MVSLRLTIDDQVMAGMEALLDDLPMEIVEIMRIKVGAIGPQVVDELRYDPGPVAYPIVWTPSKHAEDRDKPPNTRWGYYSRQKAAFFATDGFGAGIPYRRTRKLLAAWGFRLVFETDRYLLVVFNEDEKYPFVVGDPARPGWQQRFHKNTGWPEADLITETIRFWSEAASEAVWKAYLDLWAEAVYGG